jgi:hypothetical protein
MRPFLVSILFQHLYNTKFFCDLFFSLVDSMKYEAKILSATEILSHFQPDLFLRLRLRTEKPKRPITGPRAKYWPSP